MSHEDDIKDAVQITTGQHQVPAEAKSFAGIVTVNGKNHRAPAVSSRCRPLKPLLFFGRQHQGKCGKFIQNLLIQPSGCSFEPRTEDIEEWVASYEEDGSCVTRALFENPPLTLGMAKAGLELAFPNSPQVSVVER